MLKIDQYFGEVIGKSLMANGLFFCVTLQQETKYRVLRINSHVSLPVPLQMLFCNPALQLDSSCLERSLIYADLSQSSLAVNSVNSSTGSTQLIYPAPSVLFHTRYFTYEPTPPCRR